jgi:hypothetical protein
MILNPKPYTVRRFSKSLVNHVVVEAQEDEFTIYGNLQPMTDRELSQAPEGFRSSPGKKWKLYVDALQPILKIGNEPGGTQLEPDRIVFGQILLFVQGLEDQSTGVLAHRKWMCRESETEVQTA